VDKTILGDFPIKLSHTQVPALVRFTLEVVAPAPGRQAGSSSITLKSSSNNLAVDALEKEVRMENLITRHIGIPVMDRWG